MKHTLSSGQKLMRKDGVPAFLLISQAQRNEAWVRRPPKAVSWVDPKVEKWTEARAQQKKEATAKRIAKLLASKKKAGAAPFDATGLRWCPRTNKWINEEERAMKQKQLTISSYDAAGEKIVRGCTSVGEDATEAAIDARMADAAKRGGLARVVRIVVTDEQGQVRKAWSLEENGPLPIPAPVIKTEETAMAKKAKVVKAKGKAKVAKKAGGAARKANGGGVRPGSKLEIIANLLKRKSGATEAECAKAVGWAKVSMTLQARNAGLKVSKEKGKDGVTRYFGS